MISDNFIAVRVQFPPLWCRGECISSGVATDHQSPKRGGKVVTRNPTGNPIELSGIWTGRRIHVRIVVTLNKPTRIIGLGQKARLRAGRLCNRPRDTPEKPGEEWGPSFDIRRR